MNTTSKTLKSESCRMLEESLLAAVYPGAAAASGNDSHRRSCEACGGAYADALDIVAALRSLPQPQVTRDLSLIVPDLIEQRRKAVFFRRRGALPRIAAAAAVAIAALAIAIHGFRGSPAAGGPAATGGSDGEREALAGPTAGNAAAHDAAIEWILANQRTDGLWDPGTLGERSEHIAALSALAVLALADDPDSANYTEPVRRGAEALLTLQEESGAFAPRGAFAMYNHGIVTLAMLRAYALCEEPAEWSPGLESALAFIRLGQQPAGGWGYRPWPTDEAANTSVSAWQIQALGQARHMGWGDPGGHLRRGLYWLSTMADKDGLVGYHKAGDLPSSRLTTTALGLYCLADAGTGISGTEAVAESMARALAELVSEQSWAAGSNPYRDYFISSAVRAWSASGAGKWAPPDLSAMRVRLESTQNTAGDERGSWEPSDSFARVGGKLYTTSLGAMALNCRE